MIVTILLLLFHGFNYTPAPPKLDALSTTSVECFQLADRPYGERSCKMVYWMKARGIANHAGTMWVGYEWSADLGGAWEK